MDDLKAGDLIAISGKAIVSNLIQLGTCSVPNIGPLGRRGLAGISHVGVVAPVWGEMLVYESTSFGRPPCVRTGRQDPKGVQVHWLSSILEAGGDVFHYPIRRSLYEHEENRLLEALESCVGRDYDYIGAGRAWGGVVAWMASRILEKEKLASMFCSELVAHAWNQVGILQCRNAGAWNPNRLCRYAVSKGICDKGRLIS